MYISDLKDFPATRNWHEMLKYLRENAKTSYEPSFIPGLGFCYKGLESFSSLGEQVEFFRALEKVGAANTGASLSISVLKCSSCHFPYFCIKNVCTFCKSSSIVRGTAIEHDVCGNVDFDYKYNSINGKLICDKCNKELKAMGVDYSKTSPYYKCLQCNSALPSIEQHNGCLHCGRFLTQDDLQILQLFTYTINPKKLSSIIDKNNYLDLLNVKLNSMGIKSTFPGTITGLSNIEHTFDLVVYDDKDDNTPLLVGDILESPYPNGDTINTNNETIALLSFLGKSVDVRVHNKIFISLSKLSDRWKVLADTHGINLVEISHVNEDGDISTYDDDSGNDGRNGDRDHKGNNIDLQSHTDYVSQTADTIYRLCRSTVVQ
jgi:hypothetical protein